MKLLYLYYGYTKKLDVSISPMFNILKNYLDASLRIELRSPASKAGAINRYAKRQCFEAGLGFEPRSLVLQTNA